MNYKINSSSWTLRRRANEVIVNFRKNEVINTPTLVFLPYPYCSHDFHHLNPFVLTSAWELLRFYKISIEKIIAFDRCKLVKTRETNKLDKSDDIFASLYFVGCFLLSWSWDRHKGCYFTKGILEQSQWMKSWYFQNSFLNNWKLYCLVS